jgi:type III secretory pathway component EscV
MSLKVEKGHLSIVTSVLTLVILGLTAVAVYFWQNYEKEKAVNAVLNDKVSSTADNGITLVPVTPSTDSETTSSATLPVIVYTPNGLFTSVEIAELEKKLLNPFVDWHRDTNIKVVSINVEKPSPAISGYTYKITYINEGGSNGGFLFGTQKPLEWWLPECMAPAGCVFTDDFKAKYPEIVKKF